MIAADIVILASLTNGTGGLSLRLNCSIHSQSLIVRVIIPVHTYKKRKITIHSSITGNKYAYIKNLLIWQWQWKNSLQTCGDSWVGLNWWSFHSHICALLGWALSFLWVFCFPATKSVISLSVDHLLDFLSFGFAAESFLVAFPSAPGRLLHFSAGTAALFGQLSAIIPSGEGWTLFNLLGGSRSWDPEIEFRLPASVYTEA